MTSPSRSRSTKRFWLMLGILVALLVSMVYLVSSGSHRAEPLGVNQTVLPSSPPPPEWLTVATAQVKEAYAWAFTNHDLLRYIPCYCGCDEVHTDNSDCFYDRDEQGQVLDYDSHAFSCQICVEITRDVKRSVEKGKSLQQIRREIDARYQDNGARPTPTPQPPKA